MEMSKQGKGTADHILPLGDWFPFISMAANPHHSMIPDHLNLSLDTVDVIDLSFNSFSTHTRPDSSEPPPSTSSSAAASKPAAVEPPYTKVSKAKTVPIPSTTHGDDAGEGGAAAATVPPQQLPQVILRHPSNSEMSDTVR